MAVNLVLETKALGLRDTEGQELEVERPEATKITCYEQERVYCRLGSADVFSTVRSILSWRFTGPVLLYLVSTIRGKALRI